MKVEESTIHADFKSFNILVQNHDNKKPIESLQANIHCLDRFLSRLE